ncbi:MAG: T9SS type A sorting domain-containing protein [Chitinophagales bacterium]|nr:T9SS type A sorting domain-containing protein [Chitinophagaceae bacterium]MCB9064254.1 T9SS type A sorting domain-containing protein [Chitinophagales bacterium]
MKRIIPVLLLAACSYLSQAQVSITASDMPVNGDTLRYSTVLPIGSGINLNDTGANKVWSFDSLKPLIQRVDEYKTAFLVNPLYVLTIGSTAYGYKVADTFGIPGMTLPINITNVYNFFSKKSSPSRFVVEAYAAEISGAPIPAKYQDEDEWYFFPLAYGNAEDSSAFSLTVSIPSVGSMKQNGYRKTKVDGWGTISTPYYTTAQNCIRVRSEVNSVDSFQISSIPAVGITRKVVDYKWLIPGEHYPALWVTTNIVASIETITAIRYRDKYRSNGIQEASSRTIGNVAVYPNPAKQTISVTLPTDVRYFSLDVFDLQGKHVKHLDNEQTLNVSALPSGSYILHLLHEGGEAYGTFVKE